MSDRPFCSVVIPAFNEKQDIEASLSSLVNQSYPRARYEIILVDNGSTDRTPEIASAYADLILSKPDGNVGAVRNFGIASASGSVIICTDADCVVTPDWNRRSSSGRKSATRLWWRIKTPRGRQMDREILDFE